MLHLKHVLLLLEWYDYRIHRGVAEVAREAGWQLNCHKSVISGLSPLTELKADGCIAFLQSSEMLEYFRTHRVPLVDLGLGEHSLPVPRVVTDNREIGRLAAEHFRDHGYREVLVLDPRGLRMWGERMESLREFMEADGGSVTMLDAPGPVGLEVVRALKLLAKARGVRPEELSLGFFAYNDQIAARMISLCLQHGLRVPENIAVLGVDNDDLTNRGLTVGLSSIDSDQEGLGRQAAELMREMFEDPNKQMQGRIMRHAPVEVVTRHSTDCYAVDNPLVSRALHWIHSNFHTGIQAAHVAEAMGVTQQGLQKAFARHYIRSPGKEIRQQRARAAAHLLRTTDARLAALAKSCGYYTVDALISGFRAAYGTTPGRFRRDKRTPRM